VINVYNVSLLGIVFKLFPRSSLCGRVISAVTWCTEVRRHVAHSFHQPSVLSCSVCGLVLGSITAVLMIVWKQLTSVMSVM